MSNRLKSIPEELYNIKSLNTLAIRNFAPSGLMMCACCDNIGKKVSGNQFNALSSNIGKLKLKILNISSVGLKVVPKELAASEGLKYLDLSHNEINDVPNEILNLRKIRGGLRLFGNPIVKWLPLMKIQGRIRGKQLAILDQMTAHFQYCNIIGSTVTRMCNPIHYLQLIGNGLRWGGNHSKAVLALGVSAAASLTYYYLHVKKSQNAAEQTTTQSTLEAGINLLFDL